MTFKILDGAMGSELIKRGLTLPKYIWSAQINNTHPQYIHQIHKEYLDSGANFITTNTFRTTPRSYQKLYDITSSKKLAKKSLDKAVKIAKNVANSSTIILGSIAPLEDCYKPNLFPGKTIAIKEYSELAKWLINAGVDILFLETMNSIIEIESALSALTNFNFPIWISFTLKNNKLLSGDNILEVITLLNNYNINMILINCSTLLNTKLAVDYIVNNWTKKWGIYPNLGKGSISADGNITNYETIGNYLSLMKYAHNRGASILGACCGSSPKHIKALLNLKTVS